MKSVPGKRLAKLALGKGWELKRVNGSHHVFTKPGRRERLVIPIHGNKSLKPGLQSALMKIIPVSDDEL
ncbi:MAG: putative RNA binding protein YcfA (HicA-like mRNA interferase family) [Verrucomicrobiales bacterium]|jgi:predicted RNA binding protein YcfA (HicA-like mRNA interferase family)